EFSTLSLHDALPIFASWTLRSCQYRWDPVAMVIKVTACEQFMVGVCKQEIVMPCMITEPRARCRPRRLCRRRREVYILKISADRSEEHTSELQSLAY